MPKNVINIGIRFAGAPHFLQGDRTFRALPSGFEIRTDRNQIHARPDSRAIVEDDGKYQVKVPRGNVEVRPGGLIPEISLLDTPCFSAPGWIDD